jgi:hypothetical protein
LTKNLDRQLISKFGYSIDKIKNNNPIEEEYKIKIEECINEYNYKMKHFKEPFKNMSNEEMEIIFCACVVNGACIFEYIES